MELSEFFRENPRAALGFSGGVDSAYLLWAGLHWGADIRPYYVKTAFQPQFELEDALRLGRELGVEVTVLEQDILSHPLVAANPDVYKRQGVGFPHAGSIAKKDFQFALARGFPLNFLP